MTVLHPLILLTLERKEISTIKMEKRIYQTPEEIKELSKGLAGTGRLFAFGIEDFVAELYNINYFDQSYVKNKPKNRMVFPSDVALHLSPDTGALYITVSRVDGTNLKPLIMEIKDEELVKTLQGLLTE